MILSMLWLLSFIFVLSLLSRLIEARGVKLKANDCYGCPAGAKNPECFRCSQGINSEIALRPAIVGAPSLVFRKLDGLAKTRGRIFRGWDLKLWQHDLLTYSAVPIKTS